VVEPFDDESELDEQATAVPKSNAIRIHRSA
jgi:hypothetical protein